MIKIACSCGKQYQTLDEHAGKKTRCPACGRVLVAPPPPAGATPPGGADKPTPPSWWYPRGAVVPPGGPAAPAPPVESTGDRAAAHPPGGDRPAAEVVPRRGRSAWSPVAASVAGVMMLALGLLTWMRGPAPGPGRAAGDRPVAAAPSPAGRDAATAAGRTAVAPVASPVGEVRGEAGAGRRQPQPPASSPAPPGANRPRLSLLVPAYFYPAGPGLKRWEGLIAAAARAPIVAVANPANGPGDEANPDYIAVVDRADRGGVTVVGYVNTDYARRPPAEVRSEVDRWVRFYPQIKGIFFDAQASEPGHADYYAGLRDHACARIGGATVITNPGTTCSEEYGSRLPSAVLCLFESPDGFERFRLPRWAESRGSVRFAALASHIGDADRMRDCIQVASSRGIGLIYVTDARAPGLWDRLPTYWGDEVEAVRRVNLGQAP